MSGTVTAYVYALDPDEREYRLQRAELHNLESLAELTGRDIRIRRGGKLNPDLEGSADVNRGLPFGLDYTFDEDGTVVPADLHSLYALSLYRALDNTASLLRERGHTPHRQLDVLYFPRMDHLIIGDMRDEFTDNAAYYPPEGVFMMVPSFMLSKVPLLINEGVLAHEFGHSVVHIQVAKGDADLVSDSHFDSMNEGVADLIGFAVTGDPNFILPSAMVDRDLSESRSFTEADREDLANPGLFFDPHKHGSTMARAVYEMWPKTHGSVSYEDRIKLLDAMITVMQRLSEQDNGSWLWRFARGMVDELPVDLRAQACQVISTRFAPLIPGDSTSCPAS